MKILTNKKYGVLVDNIRKDFEERINKNNDVEFELLLTQQKWYDEYHKIKDLNNNLEKKIYDLEQDKNLISLKLKDKINVQRIQTRNINSLKKDIEELKKINKELNMLLNKANKDLEHEKALRKGEYTKTVLKPDRTRNTQFLGVRCSKGFKGDKNE